MNSNWILVAYRESQISFHFFFASLALSNFVYFLPLFEQTAPKFMTHDSREMIITRYGPIFFIFFYSIIIPKTRLLFILITTPHFYFILAIVSVLDVQIS